MEFGEQIGGVFGQDFDITIGERGAPILGLTADWITTDKDAALIGRICYFSRVEVMGEVTRFPTQHNDLRYQDVHHAGI